MPGAVEVRLDAVQGATPPPDTFVGMRVGDVQKQSRFGSTRTYRFPNPGDSRASFGRIEVFKRIGSLTVDLDKSSQECQVPCHYPDFQELKVNLNVKADETWERPATREKRSKAKQRMEAAQTYLQKFQLEDLLAAAMREVIRMKPDNPHRFLSDYILDNAQQGMLPSIKDAAKGRSDKLPIAPPMPMEKSAPPPPLPPQQIRSSTREKLPPLQQDMHKSLPPAPAPAASKAAAPVRAAPDSRISVSPPAWLLPAKEQATTPTSSGLPQSILPMKWYYMSNFAGPVASGVCLNLFPPKLRPPTETKTKAEVVVQAPKSDVELMREQVRGALHEATRNGDFERALQAVKGSQKPEPFKYLPSVGTWCAMRLPKVEPPPEKLDFNKLPSVGTWLARAPKGKNINNIQQEEMVEKADGPPFCYRPSVGTWLMKTPSKVERPWYLQQIDGGEYGQFITKLQGVISEKDNELEKLKAQLAELQQKGPAS